MGLGQMQVHGSSTRQWKRGKRGGIRRKARKALKEVQRGNAHSSWREEYTDALAEALHWHANEEHGEDAEVVQIQNDFPETEDEEQMLVPFVDAPATAGWGDLNLDEVLAREEEEERIKQRHMGDPAEAGPERVFLVGVGSKGSPQDGDLELDIEDSLAELGQLADTAGLQVVGSLHQRLERTDPRTYLGSGKLQELRLQVAAAEADTVIFDDELAPKKRKKIEAEMQKVKRQRVAEGEEETVRVADRTELILDIFQQRASTKEARLQVEMARLQCQLPRLTKMWSHLEREKQSGKGTQRGMGEKQIEVDKRQIRSQISRLRKKIENVRKHRRQHRRKRAKSEIPIVSCVGYTNAGKSTLLNQLSTSRVRVEDKLFATLDPTTRRAQLPRGKQILLTDTVGFIQKLPTQLVAAFRATLEEIQEAHMLLHVVDVSDPNAPAQVEAANRVLEELGATEIPQLMVWNKIDMCEDSEWMRTLASSVNSVCISAKKGNGIRELRERIEHELSQRLVQVQAQIPWKEGELYDELSRVGVIESVSWEFEGIQVQAQVPVGLSKRLLSYTV